MAIPRRLASFSLIAFSFFTLGIPASVVADSPSVQNSVPTEIFVYGASRELTLLDLPGGATVLDTADRRERSLLTAAEVVDLVPGLSYAGGSSRPRFFQIRGIGEFEQYEGAPNPSVGVFIDDIDFSGLGVVSSLFDIERFEVLRGPQATRFGANALAGVISLRSLDPAYTPSGIIEAGFGNDELGSVAAAVSGPLDGTAGRVRVRFSTSYLSQDGFRDNVFLSQDDTNRRRERTTRLKVVTAPQAGVQVTGTYLNVDNRNGYDAFSIFNGFTTYSDRPGRDDIEVHAGSLRGEFALAEALELEAVSSMLYSDQLYSYDGDWGNNPFWDPFVPYDYFFQSDRARNSFSQELRLKHEPASYIHGESFRWALGGYFQRLHEETSIGEFFEQTQYRDLSSDYLANTGAAFIEIELPLNAGTSVTTGIRAERRLTDYDDSNAVSLSSGRNMLGGSVSLAQDLSDELRSYLTLARGFKGGGVNPGTRVPTEDRLYGPEYLWSVEAGLKGAMLEKRLEGSLSAFFARRNDAQLKFAFQYDPADPLAFTYVTKNEAEARVVGTEAALTYRASDALLLFSNATLMQTEFTSVPPENAALDGREQSHAPTWSFLAGARYALSENWFARAEVVGKDAFYFDDSHDARSSAYHLLNASVGYRGANWSWTLWGRNILNRRYAVRGFFFGVEPPNFEPKEYVQRGDPVAFGTTLTFYF